MVRKVRTRTKSRKTSSTKTTRAKTKTTRGRKASSGFDRGSTGFKKAGEKRQRQEEEYARRKNTPFDFRLKPGDEAEVVILDDQEPFFISLHKIKTQQGRWVDEVCIADTGTRCPLCDSQGREGSYTMMLTVLDRRPYKVQNGPNKGKVIKVSKKLMPVKGRNLAKFERQFKKHKGNWRGLRVMCRRDGDKEAAIGEDLEFLGKVKESALKKFKDIATPAPYEEIFEIPSASEIRKRHNLDRTGVAGSEEFDNDKDDDGYDMDNVGWD